MLAPQSELFYVGQLKGIQRCLGQGGVPTKALHVFEAENVPQRFYGLYFWLDKQPFPQVLPPQQNAMRDREGEERRFYEKALRPFLVAARLGADVQTWAK
ncbi:condensation domain-containing [Lasius niger]|uniref:Condensation domain-containing n=1 Tax=Lasius niger TaxID=67767 RepID=A0A0J7NF70_LASNI|nr:condensation domain-containing [Lasius niger]